MILKVFTKKTDENNKSALGLAEDISKDYKVEYLDYDSKEASQLIDIYNIYSTPSFFVVSEEGILMEGWQGNLPRLSDLKNALNR